MQIIKKQKTSKVSKKILKIKSKKKISKKSATAKREVKDSHKRAFVKMMSTVGVGALLYSIFPKKASALMFGSSPHAVEATAIKNINGDAINSATEETLQSVAGMNIPKYDYVSVAYPTNSSEIYTYKLGGSGGNAVAMVTVAYADSTKERLISVSKS